MMDIKGTVYGFKTKHEYGFTRSEIDTLLKNFENIKIDMAIFNESLRYNTVMSNHEGDTIYYPVDVARAIRCGILKKHTEDWD